MWNRARTEDNKRVEEIQNERDRIERETRRREELLQVERIEREKKDKARKEEIRRQEELLSGRKMRAKTADPSVDRLNLGPNGIQIYHYKDPGKLFGFVVYIYIKLYSLSVWMDVAASASRLNGQNLA